MSFGLRIGEHSAVVGSDVSSAERGPSSLDDSRGDDGDVDLLVAGSIMSAHIGTRAPTANLT
jgi:hypothetical protein